MKQPDTQYAMSKDGYVAYQVLGEGPLDVVFIPWWVSNLDAMWEEPSIARFLRRLATFSRLVCFDKRGTGVSDPVPLAALPTLERWSDDVRTVMDAVGSKRAALVGHGTGGQMAMLFAATHPERTAAVVLVDTSARRLRDVDYPWGLPADRMPAALAETECLWGTGGNLDFVAPSVARDERFRRWYGRYERLAMPPRAATAIYAVELVSDLRGVLPAIRVPTLVVHRTGNRLVRIGQGRYLAAHIDSAKLVEVPGDDFLFHVGETDTMLGEIEEFLTGMRTIAEIDRVLATVLFTDIVGSTQHAAGLGDRAWRALLDTHHEIVRRELERHRGREVQLVGDGFLATFDGPARAIRCAGAIVKALRAVGLDVRTGLHTGEIEFTADSVRGIAVHIGARIAAEAGAGEVVVSGIVKDLVAGSGIRFADRGLHVLKGVPGDWPLFSVENAAA